LYKLRHVDLIMAQIYIKVMYYDKGREEIFFTGLFPQIFEES
jgi:hypothetical protein